MHVAEQRVMCDTGLKKKFFEALSCLGIKVSPSIRCDLFNKLLRKIYNIRCNEFVRSEKCLEEHNDKQTQDRQVMLRHKLKESDPPTLHCEPLLLLLSGDSRCSFLIWAQIHV